MLTVLRSPSVHSASYQEMKQKNTLGLGKKFEYGGEGDVGVCELEAANREGEASEVAARRGEVTG